MSIIMPVVLFALCALCIFLYWFLRSDAYFTKEKTKDAIGEVMQVVSKNETVQYQVRFEDADGILRTALSPHYLKTDKIKETYKVNIRYVSFKVGKKAILAVRLKKDGLERTDTYGEVLAVAILFALVGALYCIKR